MKIEQSRETMIKLRSLSSPPSLYHYLLLLPPLLIVLVNKNCGVIILAHEITRLDFSSQFVFGSGTSAYQVEGAAFEDGRTPSIWDTSAHAGYSGGSNADTTCDEYHKYKEDVKLMADMGLEAFRFSISWSRLVPNGRGAINPKGLQYYNNFINELMKHGIQPHATLFHIDLPQILEDEYGGWVSRKSVKDFVAYAEVCFREFGDRVLHWTTVNEANIYSVGGYDQGISPPLRCSFPFGLKNCSRGNSSTEPYIVGHNILLAHASATRLYHEKYKATQKGFVGINLYAFWFVPQTKSTEDEIATQRAIDFYIGWFLNPLVYGDYPEIMKKNAGSRIPTFTEQESVLVKGSFDFIGLNHYITLSVADKSSDLQMDVRDFVADIGMEENFEWLDSYEYPINPSGLQQLLEYLKFVYGNPPVYIHENGQRSKRNGELNDTSRVDYMRAFIGSLPDAIRNGSNTRGYFYWAFLDGFELLDGYESSFGLNYVDLDDKDLTRYPKLSAKWYTNFLKGENSSRRDEIIRRVDEGSVSAGSSSLSQFAL